MSGLARTDTSLVGRWWWTVDRWALGALLVLAGIGIVLVLAASPAVAERAGLDGYHFARRQGVFLILGLVAMVAISLMSPRGVRRVALLMLGASVVGMGLTLLIGAEVNGAQRWIRIFGLSLQPSEFLKPAFAVTSAWMLAQAHYREQFPGRTMALGLLVLMASLLLLQPDLGQTLVLCGIWAMQVFVAGLPIWIMGLLAFAGIGLVVGAYFTLGHVRSRIDTFLDPGEMGYQAKRSAEAFSHGGMFGTGPGEGSVKTVLPDAHTDFIFAVAGEEFGLIFCLAIVGLFAFVVLRGFSRLYRDQDLFVLLAGTGILTQIAAQTFINMASAVHLIPPKGMTLPFISYGGSSTLALGIGLGMLLAFTRERPRVETGWARKPVWSGGGVP
ncbi:MAG: FtsW/RodA/SpoVE family cell cycle protein [Magnetovibrionaceae bacterium]